ncbi:MAG: hypothetical protein ABIV94_11310, partial [Acidimicrobiales bacterium]
MACDDGDPPRIQEANMNIRKTLAGVLLAGTLAITGATAASAQAEPPPTAPAHPKLTCESAVQHVATWQ